VSERCHTLSLMSVMPMVVAPAALHSSMVRKPTGPAPPISTLRPYFTIRTGSVTEIPLHFCSFHVWILY
jgi:hypothetical protein